MNKLDAMLMLHDREGFSLPELAAAFGWSASKVRYLLRHRCWPWNLAHPRGRF